MDALVRLHVAAQPLLARVDAALAGHGAPADHPIWPLLRRRALLPGDAVANMVAWEPEPLRERARILRTHHERCAAVAHTLRAPSTWEGAAAATFADRLETTRGQHDTLAANTATLAGYLDELADWVAHGRARLAHTLTTILTSAECLTLTAAVTSTAAPFTHRALPTARATAAADIGASLLATADHFWHGALSLSDAWSARLEPTPPPAPTPSGGPHPALSIDF